MRIAAPILVCFVLASACAGSLSAVCTPSSTVLCMQGRFEVDVSWVDSSGGTRAAHAETFSAPVSADDTGYFWFTDARYVEVYVRVLDACSLTNRRYWVFFGSLTDVEYTLTVTDTESPATASYVNLAGERTVVTDTDALDACPSPPVSGARTSPRTGTGFESLSLEPSSSESGFGKGVLIPCTPDATTLCLVGDRFQLQMSWATSMQSGDGYASPVTSHTGAFWFFSAQSLEVAVKIVESCPAFEVHVAGLTDLEYTLEVTDTHRGGLWSYTHPLATPAAATADLMAFPRSCLFGDGFESGGVGSWSMVVGVPP